MKQFNVTVILLLSLLVQKTITSKELELVTITSLRKSVKVTVDGIAKKPVIGEKIPLHSKIECNRMGFLEFEYKNNVYRINKDTTILISRVIASGIENRNYQPQLRTTVSGVRGLDKKKKRKLEK